MMFIDNRDIQSMKIEGVVERIINFNKCLNDFWSNAFEWAPLEAAQLLSKSRLDWQVSLSKCLKLWVQNNNEDIENESGRLILAWANLGSLVEGTMKLFLSIFYNDYKDDIDAIRKGDKLIDPDVLDLERMRHFFKKRIWEENYKWDEWVLHVQHRRNAIHAYRNREIGTFEEYYKDLRNYLLFLRYHNERFPYPDEVSIPRF
ncbi:hypothetical protein [Caloranaerobacter sp. TR13]|uniref:hypothetical protein n=1 Tax=Caloranaerobacter sp. TR13 TaxID=1302151 RepID=UPI0006D4055D|nr:hypothetical protein [Caloranaerobacter sp. TR13]